MGVANGARMGCGLWGVASLAAKGRRRETRAWPLYSKIHSIWLQEDLCGDGSYFLRNYLYFCVH